MSKVVAFIGSPHKEGRTTQLVQEIVRGAKESGAEVTVHYASETDFGPCRGCFSCSQDGECANKDGMQAVMADVKESDVIIVGSPVYCCQVSSQAKMFLDRLLPLVAVTMSPDGPVLSPRYPTKKLMFAYTHNVVPTDAYAKYYKWMRFSMSATPGAYEIMDDVVMGGCIYPEPPALTETLEKAYATGQTLAYEKSKVGELRP